ncbi:MAG: hypothetical protein KGH60_04990 [Candidatus Micrarchaeota archaeon]|nr:hypothetical protein [Candidatus Micrarchaeota archaeon]
MRTKDNLCHINMPIGAFTPLFNFNKKVFEALESAGIDSGMTGLGSTIGLDLISRSNIHAMIHNACDLDTLDVKTIKEKILPIARIDGIEKRKNLEENMVLASKIYLEFERKYGQGDAVLELLQDTDMVGEDLWDLFEGYYKRSINKMISELCAGVRVIAAAKDVEEFLGNRGLSIRKMSSE